MLGDEDLKNMGLKFGHRKYLVDVLRRLDILSTFLEDADLVDHKERLKKLGFDSEWSILGVLPEYADQMGLTQEEMTRWMKAQAKMVGA